MLFPEIVEPDETQKLLVQLRTRCWKKHTGEAEIICIKAAELIEHLLRKT